MFRQMYSYFNEILSKDPLYLFIAKGYSTQHGLLAMTEKWKKVLIKGRRGGAPLADLSKAFYILEHVFLIAKLVTYGFKSQ